MATWDELDREQWRSILTHNSLHTNDMVCEAFLSAIDKIERLEARLAAVSGTDRKLSGEAAGLIEYNETQAMREGRAEQ